MHFVSFSLFSQNRNWTLYPKKEVQLNVQKDTVQKELQFGTSSGKVNITQPSEIDSLQSALKREPFIYGYSVQIEVSQQKEVIKKARYRFLKAYPDVPLDQFYNQPNTYLYGGRFYDKNTAYEFKNKIKKYFPDAIVIRKKMDLPPLKTIEEN